MINLKKHKSIIIWSIISASIIGFIFLNSVLDGSASNSISSGLSAKLHAFISLFFEIDFEIFHIIIRKAAHFTEFAVLGFSLTMLMKALERLIERGNTAAVMFTSLAVAVTDEFIQLFTGRTSAVYDVIIDFGGAMFGFLMTIITISVIYKKSAEI